MSPKADTKRDHSFGPPEDVEALFLKRLADSGLTYEDAKILGMSYHSVKETKAIHPDLWAAPCMSIPYFTTHGAPMDGGLLQKHFSRFRLLRDPLTAPANPEKGHPKYLQIDKVTRAYFPRNLPDWKLVVSDPTQELIITEGELKAAKACKHGFPTVGLGGVHSFCAKKRGVWFLPELLSVAWRHRTTIIVFDADVTKNQNVAVALMELADILNDLGAIPKFLILPSVYKEKDKKTGLDDYLLFHKPEELRFLLDKYSEHLTLATDLRKLNEDYAWVRDIDYLVRLGTQKILDPIKLKNAVTAKYCEKRIDKRNGTVSQERVNAAGPWLAWPLRREVAKLDYVPGATPLSIISCDNGTEVYNLWPGWACTPKEGNVEPFLMLVSHLITEDEMRNYLLDWLAYPLQYPGTKLATTFLLFGLCQGTGKTLIAYTLKHIYGKNYSEIDEKKLQSDFNPWFAYKQFILIDELTGYSNRRVSREELNRLVTQDEVTINIKHNPQYTLKDTMNIFNTSNQPDALQLEQEDRRTIVYETLATPLPIEFYTHYTDVWLKQEEGASAVFHYLLNRDLSNFRPNARAVMTEAKKAMMHLTTSDVGYWCRMLQEQPEKVIGTSDYDLFTIQALHSAYDPENNTRIGKVGLGRELARAGFRQAYNGRPVGDGKNQDRYWIIRNFDKWFNADHKALHNHVKSRF